jgi:hypothetical protein
MPKLPQPSPPSPTHSEVSFSTARRQSTYSTLSNGTDETESTSIGTPGLGLGDSGIMCGPPWILQDSEGHELESEYHQEGEEHQAWCSAKTEESEYSFPKYTSTSDFTRGTSPSFSGSVSGLSAAAGRLTGSSRASARTGGGKVLHGHSPALVESVTELVLRVEEWRLGLSSGPTQLK